MSTIQTPPAMNARALLRLRDFRLLWLAQCISDFGDSLTMLGLLLLINSLTGSAAAIATLMIVMAIPQIVIGLLAGVYVDRLDRKQIMLGSDLLRGVLMLGFILVTTTNQLWILFVLAFFQAGIGTFFTPARSALLPAVVPETGLMAANSTLEISRVICGLLGTATAGLLLGVFHIYWPLFVIDAATFFAAVALVSRLQVRPEISASATGSVRTILSELRAGLSIVWRTNALLGTLIAMGVAMLGLGAVNILLVQLIINDLNVAATWFAGIEFAQTSAMILSGVLVVGLAKRLKPTNIVLLGLLGSAGLIMLLALVTNVWQLLAILFGVGWIVTPLQAATATISQTSVAADLRGRSAAARSTIVSVANLISMGTAGMLAGLIGIRSVFLLAGGILILAALGAGLIFRRGVAPAASVERPTAPIPPTPDVAHG